MRGSELSGSGPAPALPGAQGSGLMVAGWGLEKHGVAGTESFPLAHHLLAVQRMVSAQLYPLSRGSAVTRAVCWGRLGTPGGHFPQPSP